LLAEKR